MNNNFFNKLSLTSFVSRPGVETATRICQQIRHPYGKPRIGEASNLQKIITNKYTDIRAENKSC